VANQLEGGRLSIKKERTGNDARQGHLGADESEESCQKGDMAASSSKAREAMELLK
jgi:hypothetical protein